MVTNLTNILEDKGLIPGLAQGLGTGAAVSCAVGRRHGSDVALLWLWHTSQMQLGYVIAVAVAVAGSFSSNLTPRACELSDASSAALKKKRKKKV